MGGWPLAARGIVALQKYGEALNSHGVSVKM